MKPNTLILTLLIVLCLFSLATSLPINNKKVQKPPPPKKIKIQKPPPPKKVKVQKPPPPKKVKVQKPPPPKKVKEEKEEAMDATRYGINKPQTSGRRPKRSIGI
ncbi:2868_t:CDS:2 [Funneliformis mosseae]|uniref:2868_t:CDS:1 n=1 Tax=Funneliformis mosseae TaxID=27381 RepID=A0A9N8WSQ3_FUNMO|nr:2868_t:CDS:2 [Funneliformis mosseae]